MFARLIDAAFAKLWTDVATGPAVALLQHRTETVEGGRIVGEAMKLFGVLYGLEREVKELNKGNRRAIRPQGS